MELLKPTLRTFRIAILGGVVAWLACFTLRADLSTRNPYDVVAGDLHAFTSPNYIRWPTNAVAITNAIASTNAVAVTNAVASTNSPPPSWRIGILGGDPFGDTLLKTLKDHPVDGRDFEIIHAQSAAELLNCHIVYISTKDEEVIGSALTVFAKHPVLTVGEADDFLKLGGMIRMEFGKNVHFSVNLDRARAAGLKISAGMLEVANQVIENGRLKKLK